MRAGSNDTDPTSDGLSRRDLIRRSAVAGAVAWTAPVVLGSLASPAAATSATGCYKFSYYWQHGSRSTTQCDWATSSQCRPTLANAACTPGSTWNPAAPPAINFTNCSYNGYFSASSTVNVTSPNCKIVSIAWSNSTCNGSLNPVAGGGSSSVASGAIGTYWGSLVRVVFVVQCT